MSWNRPHNPLTTVSATLSDECQQPSNSMPHNPRNPGIYKVCCRDAPADKSDSSQPSRRLRNGMTGLRTSSWHPDDRVPPQDQPMTPRDRLITVQELAHYLDVPIATIYAWRHRRQGPPGFRVGRHLRYRRSDVEEWINERLLEEFADAMLIR